jgi:tRNA pseudouridine38-40 synthase
VRTLRELSWSRDPDGVAVGTVRADAFCHHMVRSLVGALVAVGEGRRDPDWPAAVLHAGTRDPAVTVVHAHGLTLEAVGYPEDAELATQAVAARRVRVLGG